MPSPTYYSILTTAGLAKIANAIATSTPIQITQMALGDGNGSIPTPNASQTALVHQVYREDLSQLITDPDNPAYAIAELIVPAEDGPFTVRELGLYDSSNTLIAVGNFPTTYKPVASEGSVRDLVIRMVIDVENASSVTITIDPAVVLASQEYVQNKLKDTFIQDDGEYIATDKVRARDGDGLSLQDDGGNGIFIADGGNATLSGPTTSAIDGPSLTLTRRGDHAPGYKVGSLKFTTTDPQVTGIRSEITALAESTSNWGPGGQGRTALVFKTGDSDSDATEKMRITSYGKVGIGTASPGTQLEVRGAGNTSASLTVNSPSGSMSVIDTQTQAQGSGPGIAFGLTYNSGANSSGTGSISTYMENVPNNTSSDFMHSMIFKTSTTSGIRESLRINSSGDILPGVDDAQDLGSSSKRYDDVYATNATIQTSDERLKTNIEDTPLGLDFINALRAVRYKWANRESQTATRMVQKTELVEREIEQTEIIEIDGKYVRVKNIITQQIAEPVFDEYPVYDEDGEPIYTKIKLILLDEHGEVILGEDGNPTFNEINGPQLMHKIPVMIEEEYEVPGKAFTRRHYGLIAQDVLAVLEQFNVDSADFAPLTYDSEADLYGMRYGELVGILIKAIQELTARVEVLES
ncbi:MAG: phage tail protein [Candidatus Margulisiibacteriota bacterium]